MLNILKDLRFALRQLRRSPAFAVTAIFTLALGIGANTTVFSLLDQALLRALPVKDPGQLVILRDSDPRWWGAVAMSSGGDVSDTFSYPQYRTLRDSARGFAGLLATTSSQTGLSRNNATQIVADEAVSGNYFQVLGVPPHLGRLLQPSDDTASGANSVAVLSYAFWQAKLGADPAIVGSTIRLSGRPFEVIGVAAPNFNSAVWGQSSAVFIPMSMVDQVTPQAGNRYIDHTYKWLNILGRLAPGVTAAKAQAENQQLWNALRMVDLGILGGPSDNYKRNFLASKILILPGARGFNFNRSGLEKPLFAVMAMAVLVLLIASVNVASLIMVRSAGRSREFSLRTALGASSARVVSQLLIEGVLIGLCGGVVGILLAPFALRVLISRLSDTSGQTPFTSSIDNRILLFNFSVAIAVSVLFSLFPAFRLRRPNLNSALRESTGTGAGGTLLLRRIVVCLQIGLSVVLLVGAGLFMRTMQQLRKIDLGFSTTHLLTFSIDPLLSGYAEGQISSVQQRVLAGLATLPGIQSVAGSDSLALGGNGGMYGIDLSQYVKPPDEAYQVTNAAVTPNYLETLKIPLIAGRNLADTDDVGHPNVAIVDQTFVKHYCNGSNVSCMGRFIGIPSSRDDDKPRIQIQIVGIFRSFHYTSIRDTNPAIMFRPLKQETGSSQLFLSLRTTLPPVDSENDVRNAMRRIDSQLPLTSMVTMDEQIDSNLKNERIITLLAVSFGVLATLLAGVGLYGVLAYSTNQRMREIGVRMALGSTRWAVVRLILADVLVLTALGIVIAIPVASALSAFARSLLFGASAADPFLLLTVVGLTAAVAVLSALIPARRAATVSPMMAIQAE